MPFNSSNLIFVCFSRHGIDLDNPGPAGSQASLIAAAAQQGFAMDGTLNSLNQLTSSLSVSVTGATYSDSGDSTGARSTDNATPPMHFLTPHVEISMTDAPVPGFPPSPVSFKKQKYLKSKTFTCVIQIELV